MDPDLLYRLRDPMKFFAYFWPDVTFYREQRKIIYSVEENDETVVGAGNMLGKDFVAGYIVPRLMITRHPCRIVTTSAKDDHLDVLWGEIGRAIQTCRFPLDCRQGGPLIIQHHALYKMMRDDPSSPYGTKCPISYAVGMVASADKMAAMQGHHVAHTGDGIPRAFFISDESSSVPDDYYKMARTWFHRAFIFGNTWACDNFFKRAIKGKPGTDDCGGDLMDPDSTPEKPHLYRKVFRIRGEDSPNVRLAVAEIAAGRKPSGRIIIPGVLPYNEYVKRRRLLDKVEQTVTLDAEFYEGADVLMFPPEWLNSSNQRARALYGKTRYAKAIGIDPAEGGDRTAMAAVDEYGLIELVSKKTPDTSMITGEAIAFGKRHGVSPENWLFDAGGGGKQHADRLRKMGFKVRTVRFGESINLDPKRGLTRIEERIDVKEERYAYLNRRAEMYGILRNLINPDPAINPHGFGLIPSDRGEVYAELRRQLAPIPMWHDDEGRIFLPPKNLKPGQKDTDNKVTLVKLIGHSPDEADAVVLATHGLTYKKRPVIAGAVG